MTMIFGHRGAAGTSPENTMISFKEAIHAGADGIELDVHLSKDQIPVVIHDETVNRTTNGTGYVKDHLAEELIRLNAGRLFNEEAPIPLLKDVLKWACESEKPFIINIELKNNMIEYSNIEEIVIQLVKEHKLSERIILSSFNHSSMVQALKTDPVIETALLYSDGIYKPYDYARRAGARAIHPLMRTVKNELINQARENSVAVRPFTVNDEEEMRTLFEWGASAFFTDYPEKAVRIRESIT
ncbi:glycerophosphodiester phosphodiesterase [Metabacillus sp. 113a]|uniref:glycerophosphodiester phosphodiesterase n=1 Tax=Metabacillus sp. 113a TaxID=3404706 RepID=UPI003CF7E385